MSVGWNLNDAITSLAKCISFFLHSTMSEYTDSAHTEVDDLFFKDMWMDQMCIADPSV